MRTRMSAAVIVVSLVFAAAAAIAQNPDNGNAGQITGTVRDSGGNTMPGVRVEVLDLRDLHGAVFKPSRGRSSNGYTMRR